MTMMMKKSEALLRKVNKLFFRAVCFIFWDNFFNA